MTAFALAFSLGALRGAVTQAVPAGDPCALVAAMLAIDDRGYQDEYKSCGELGRKKRRIVEVDAPPSLVPPGTKCPGRDFAIYDGDPSVDFLIPKLDVWIDGDAVRFTASSVQPNPRAVPGGGFDSSQTYCYADGGFAQLRDGHWRTFVDDKRAHSK